MTTTEERYFTVQGGAAVHYLYFSRNGHPHRVMLRAYIRGAVTIALDALDFETMDFVTKLEEPCTSLAHALAVVCSWIAVKELGELGFVRSEP